MAGYLSSENTQSPVRNSGLHLEREVRAGKLHVDIRLIDVWVEKRKTED